MKLAGPELQRLHQAICDAYTLADLKILVRFALDVDVEHVVNQSINFRTFVFNLLVSFEMAGTLVKFVAATRADRPENADLRRVLDDIDRILVPTVVSRWTPAVLYPLQPAPHFAGRDSLLAELTGWALDPADPNRVVAIVAAGGTGKTALAERVLASLKDYADAGLFVWSFYENPKTESFFRAACEYIFGEAINDAAGFLERLQHGIAGTSPHLFVLDGLELVQATGATGPIRGQLEESHLKRFLRWLAAGYGTRAKALITSRFPLRDLDDYIDKGFRSYELEDLDPASARQLLRRRGVKGSDGELDALAERVHRHALTVDVLGLYLQRFGGGDPRNVPRLDIPAAKSSQKAVRLSKVLESYADKLPGDESDLLSRLSLFPRGVTIEYLRFMADKGSEIGGALAGYDSSQLHALLEGMRELGLVFHSVSRDGSSYSAHPFLRDFFRTRLGGAKPEQIHEVVRQHLADGLQARPGALLMETRDLDLREHLIEETRLAGRLEEALDLYDGMGAITHLSLGLGENSRGLRILSGFSKDASVRGIDGSLPRPSRATIAREWGCYTHVLGDISTARTCYQVAQDLCDDTSQDCLAHVLRETADVERAGGCFTSSRRWAERACQLSDKLVDHKLFAYSCMASTLMCLGEIAGARRYFGMATEQQQSELVSGRGVAEAELKYLTGDLAGALSSLMNNLESSQKRSSRRDVALCEGMLGFVHLAKGNTEAALSCLRSARAYAESSGHVEMQLRCYRLSAAIATHDNNRALAVSEASAGLALADVCGLGRWSLELRIELAKAHLEAGDPEAAIPPAQSVLARSQEEDCQYAWGVADSLHLLGMAHTRLGREGNGAKAREYLARAAERRRILEHPGMGKSLEELLILRG